jgi:hypothetical protein
MQRVLAAVLLVVATAGVAAAAALAGERGDPKPGEARLVLRDPAVVAERGLAAGGGGWTRARDGDLLHSGERVRVVSGGEAGLIFANDVRMALLGGGGGELAIGTVPELVAGELLVETGSRAAQTVDAGESSFAFERSSAGRLHRSLDAGAAVYAGLVDIDSAGRRLAVPALRAASVPALGLVPSQPSPIELDPDDPWDVRFLGGAMDLAAELDAGSAGFSAQAPSVESSSLLSLVPGASGDAGGVLRGRRTGDQLVAAAIAASSPGRFSERLTSVVGFRDEGASWGLVALDQAGVGRGRVVGLVRAAISDWLGRTGGFAAGPAAVAEVAAPAVSPLPAPSPPASTPSGDGGSGGSGPPSPTPTAPTTPVTPVPPPTTPPVTTPVPPPTLPPIRTGTPIDDVIDAIGLDTLP